MKITNKPLFILEMANNHMGDVEHGVMLVREFKKVTKEFEDVFDFSFKLQLRDETIIHPDYRDRMDIKHIKRFSETRLATADFIKLKDEIKSQGFITMCTPFDEPSVRKMKELDFDIFKVASCSFADWPLMEEFTRIDKPIIISTGSIPVELIDAVVSFFKHRNKAFSLMHCVTAYPTQNEDLQLNQIDFLKHRYSGVDIGFSTHEEPDCVDAIKMAIAKGCRIFEKHVGIPTEKYEINAYSSTPEQVHKWLETAKKAFEMCGVANQRMEFKEEATNGVKPFIRGAFTSKKVLKGEKIETKDLFLAMPNFEGQVIARDLSKYTEYIAKCDMEANSPILLEKVEVRQLREEVYKIIRKAVKMLKDANVAVPNGVDCSLSAHYGIKRFEEYGLVMLNVLNREYCKKLLVMFPEQEHPMHMHKVKEETFHILSGDFIINVDGTEKVLNKGDLLTIDRGQRHSFRTTKGVIIEEISTTHIGSDSYYDDEIITNNPNRKIDLTLWADEFESENE